ncbi:MAG: LPS export ABC transporter permease LptF [Methylococcales bacterium]|jgi:lipopolysaccharide export system permease protein|nr:LPS export ABC transporter permease LptF [Methylococcales bacterium]MBT7411025.1 LPS export ABC transporter permease LptF [Methylococcales bacterium]
MIFNIIDRYLIKEVFKTFFAVFFILLLIVVSNRFVKYLSEAAAGGLSSDIIFTLLALKTIKILVLLIPVSFFFSILLALGRLYKDNEMVAMFSCGIGIARLNRTFFLMSLPIAILTAYLSLYVVPWSYFQDSVIKKQDQQRSKLTGIFPAKFNEYKQGDLVFYVEKILPNGLMNNVFIQHKQNGVDGLVTSKQAYQTVDGDSGFQYLVLVDGIRYEGTENSRETRVIEFEKYTVKIREKVPDKTIHIPRKAKPSNLLSQSDEVEDLAELQWRYAIPISLLILTMLAVPLSKVSPREGRYGKMFAAIIIYVLYFNLITVSKNWMERSISPDWLGLWWIHIPFLLLTLFLMTREGGLVGLKLLFKAKKT